MSFSNANPAPDPPIDPVYDVFREIWLPLTVGERGRIIKTLRPELSDRQVARLSGTSERNLVRDERYCEWRDYLRARPPAMSHWRGRSRRPIHARRVGGFSNPDDPLA